MTTSIFLYLFWQDTCGALSECAVLMDRGRRGGDGKRRKKKAGVWRFTSVQRGTRAAVRETGDQDSSTTTERTKGTSNIERCTLGYFSLCLVMFFLLTFSERIRVYKVQYKVYTCWAGLKGIVCLFIYL